jgi:DNA repair exonuclease SbcCD ATPase subunit
MEMVGSRHQPFMETAMSNKVRDTLGKFAPKSEVPRKVRSVNLTDDAWQWLTAVAEKAAMSRNDYLEALAEGNNPLMETVELQFQPFMETAESQLENDDVMTQQLNSEVSSLMETVQGEIESLEHQVRSQSSWLEEQDQELQNLREQLDTERADRLKIEAELSELKQNFDSTATLSDKSAPDAATILSQLRAKRKKSKTDLADLEAILEILES